MYKCVNVPGDVRVSRKRSRKTVSFEESSTSENDELGEYSMSSSEDETERPRKRPLRNRLAPPLLTFDDMVKEHIKTLRSARTMRDWKSKTVDWITDTFGNGSSHIKQVISGRFRDLARLVPETACPCW